MGAESGLVALGYADASSKDNRMVMAQFREVQQAASLLMALRCLRPSGSLSYFLLP